MASFVLHPSRGLLHPAWLASLAVLALNDHVLKGSGLLPDLVTGKLSDVAGLFVAPLLLAALLRVRSWRGWVACHLAVGAVFSAIQLSAAAADGWSALMGLWGFAWVITRDPTDLLTLPALALSLWGLPSALRRPVARHARRSAELGVATVGLWCCAATSDVDEPCCEDPTGGDSDTDDGGEWDGDDEPGQLPPLLTDVYLSNATAQDVVVRIRQLRPAVVLDCDAVAEDPGGLLGAALFAPAQSWSLPANANVAVVDHPAGLAPCYAAWVEADGLPPSVLLWFDGMPPVVSVPGQGQPGGLGEVTIASNGAGTFELRAVSDVAFPADAIEPEATGECATQPDAARVGWSHPVPWGTARLDAIEVGLDGCLELSLSPAGLSPQAWYLCVPETSFPFTAGDTVALRVPTGTDPSLDAVEIVQLDQAGDPLPLPSVVAAAGSVLPAIADVQLQAVPVYGCELASEPSCGTVERPMAVLASGPDLPAVELRVGDGPQRLQGDGRAVELTLTHAQERFVLDPACALGPDRLGPDLELVIAQWPRG